MTHIFIFVCRRWDSGKVGNNLEQKKLQFKIEFVLAIFDYDSDGSCLPAIRMVQFNYLNAEIIRLHRQEVI